MGHTKKIFLKIYTLIIIARVSVKVKVGLEKLFYKKTMCTINEKIIFGEKCF